MSSQTNNQRIAVIGAGMAGLTCARRLVTLGHAVTVIEKSGDIGGRLATRRRGSLSWNHGAPHVQVTSTEFGKLLESLQSAGTATHKTTSDGQNLYSGIPDMRELLRPLGAGLDITWATGIDGLRRRGRHWYLRDTVAAEHGPFDVVLVTIPAPQASALFEHSGIKEFPALDSVTMEPCWVTLLAFQETVNLPASLDKLAPIRSYWPGGSDLVQDAHRMDRTWVLRATTEWSTERLESDRAAVAESLLDCARQSLSARLPLAKLVSAVAHRWRYATTGIELGNTHLWSDSLSLGLAGDWCLGSTAQCAFESGVALANACEVSLAA